MTIRANEEPTTRQLSQAEAHDRLDTDHAMIVSIRGICVRRSSDATALGRRSGMTGTALSGGRVSEAWDAVAAAIDHALNTADAYLDSEQAALAIRAMRP